MKKKILIIMIPILLLLVGVGVTFAWYTWNTTSEDETVLITTGVSTGATVIFSGGSDITSDNLLPTATKEEGIVKTIKVKAAEESNFKLSFYLYLDVISIEDGLNDVSYKYEIHKNGTKIDEGNFSDEYINSHVEECTTNGTDHIILIDNDEITTNVTTYTLYLWIDGNMDNPVEMSDKLSKFKLHAYGENAAMEEPPVLVEYISNLYNNAEKTTITNNSIDYYQARIYDTDTDDITKGGLMNDRLGGTQTLTSGIGNIRYYGTNPSNYIDIGDTEINDDGKEVTTLYRIIGLFKDITVVNDDGSTTTKDLVKVIRNDSIGSYSWDNKTFGIGTSNQSFGSSNWLDARLMMLLNPGYEKYNEDEPLLDDSGDIIYGYEGSLYWNSRRGTCYSGDSNATVSGDDCDFKTKETGLSTVSQEKIEKVVWYLRGWDDGALYSNEMYDKERNGSLYNEQTYLPEWKGKVALMAPSDYGYATDLTSTVCSSDLSSYNDSNSGCINNNWLYNSGKASWTLNPYTLNNYRVFIIMSYGYLSTTLPRLNSFAVYPVFYLDSELVIESGSGTESEPYVVG